MTKEQKAHVEAVLIQRIDSLAKDRFCDESDEAIARLTRELAEIHYVVCDEAERGIKPPTPIPSYDGLTPEEAQSMLADVEEAKEKKSYTPVFVGASNSVYVGGVKVEGVSSIDVIPRGRDMHEVCITFDTNRAVCRRQPKREKEGWFV